MQKHKKIYKWPSYLGHLYLKKLLKGEVNDEAFLDTANIEHIKDANEMGVLCGATTNP